MLHDSTWASEYLIHLEKEIKEYYDGDTVKTIYIGGGTPSILSVPNLTKLMNITKIFNRVENAEFTVEVNVNDITEEKLQIFSNFGVNRISIGVESFDKYSFTAMSLSSSCSMRVRSFPVSASHVPVPIFFKRCA